MTDITLVNPILRDCFPIGLGQLAAYLRNNGLNVEIVDASPRKMSAGDVINRVIGTAPRVVGFTGLWVHYPYLKDVSLGIKARARNVSQIAGGYWCIGAPDIVLSETAVDAVVCGEGERSLVELVQALLAGQLVSEVKGVAYLDGEALVRTDPQPMITDLDTLPVPAYDSFDMDFYVRNLNAQVFRANTYLRSQELRSRLGNKDVIREATMYTSRGCFGKCTFCSAPAFGIKFRGYDPQYVVDHMRLLKEKYNVDVFEITESLTFTSKKRVKDLCNAIIDANLNTFFLAVSRGDLDVTPELAELMKEAGCYLVRIGYESANERILNDAIHKNVSPEKYYQSTKVFLDAKIRAEGTFILNMPGETEESMKDSYDFVRKSKLDLGCVFYANPLPGTWLFNYAEENGFITDRRRLINENPGKDKGRSDFDTYIANFDFNKLPHRLLLGYKALIEGGLIANWNFKRRKYISGCAAYISTHVLKIPLRFPKLRENFPGFYDKVLCPSPHIVYSDSLRRLFGGASLKLKDTTKSCLEKLGLLGLVRRLRGKTE